MNFSILCDVLFLLHVIVLSDIDCFINSTVAVDVVARMDVGILVTSLKVS